ncbi:autotransporter outer membrane beta-barrel domain-containing protein, partial [Campylobacter ureolyticus]|nr:autotransporter outer membrane beta-barrel domain-containing protein [Campylobacter ureolyticus]
MKNFNLSSKKRFIPISFILAMALFNNAAFGSESDFTVIDPPFMFTTYNHKLNVGNLSTKEITLDKVSRKENVVYAAGANENDEINGYTLNVELSDIATSSDNYVVNLIGGMSENSDASYNNINITKMPEKITRDIRIFGADSWKGNTNFNKVNIDSIQTNINKLYIVGGRSTDENKGNSSNNTINIYSSKLIPDNANPDFKITGGIAQGKAKNNEVIIDNSKIINTMLSGGESYGDPDKIQLGTEKNRVKITSSEVKGMIFGGDSWLFGHNNDANKNEVEIISSKVSKYDNSPIDFAVAGGASANNATNNTVSITSSSINGDSYGGFSKNEIWGAISSGNANNNTINITSSNIGGKIYGGSSENKNANENKVSLKISSVGSSVAGGSAKYDANKNTIDITSSNIVGDVYGGYSNEGDAINNTINLFHNSGRDINTLGKHFLVKGIIYG